MSARMKRRWPLALIVALGTLSLVVAPILASSAQSSDDDPVGKDLGTLLGLTPQPWPVPGGCHYYAEYEDGMGYCLDGVVSSDVDAWELGQRINGYVPTDLERQIFQLNLQIEQLSGQGYTSDSPEMIALVDQLSLLQAEQEQASSSPTPSA